jgi:hypothetical protein
VKNVISEDAYELCGSRSAGEPILGFDQLYVALQIRNSAANLFCDPV